MTHLRIKLFIYDLLYLTSDVVHGKHIITRDAAGSNSTNIDGITCFVCGLDDGSPAKELSDCTNIQKCRPGEFCYLEHIYDTGKRTDYYVGGCRAPETCHLHTCLKDQYSRREDHTKLVHCSECCSSSYCNGKLCNLPNVHKLQYTRCYSCKNIRDPKRCHHIEDCPPNEQCRTLPTIQKRQVPFISKCCNTTLCNDHYKDENHTQIIVPPAKFICPPIPTTVSPTTLTSTMTTAPTITTTTTKTTTTAIPTTTLTTKHTTGQCRDRPGVSCTELMSINICNSLIADKYCAKSCNHCINTGHIMTPDPVITGNFLTPDPDKILGKK